MKYLNKLRFTATNLKKSLKEWFNKPNLTATSLIVILVILFFATLTIIIYFINKGPSLNDPGDKIRVEIIKSLLEVSVVTIIGSTLAALFKAYERNIEQTKIHTQTKLDFIKRIGELYRLAKKIRRKLKKEGIRINYEWEKLELSEKQYNYYANQMGLLNDVQLEIEGFKIAAENSFLFRKSLPVTEHLCRMEGYLNKILGEFEEKNPSIKISTTIDLNNFNLLKEFTYHATNNLLTDKLILDSKLKKYEPDGPTGETRYCFKNIFSNSYGKLLKDLR